jgi:glycosyltransferase involved in cell wall biosynthesis
MTSPRVSVVIPCYNQGRWLDEAVDSVLAQTYRDFEVIVVNDGSTERTTNELLAHYQRPSVRVLQTENRGLAIARNTGIDAALGDYILPLDADDMIGPRYLEMAVALLDQDNNLGIVYCRGELFGLRRGPVAAPAFSRWVMLFSNLIFCTAMFRKEDWLRVGGYNSGMVHGCEDWDFWLSILELGRTVRRIPLVLFRYRVREESMNRAMDDERRMDMFRRIVTNHPDLYLGWRGLLASLAFRITRSRLYRLAKGLLARYFRPDENS